MVSPIVPAVLVVVAIAVGVFYFYPDIVPSQAPAETPEQPAETGEGMTALEIANRISSYIETQRNAEGFYTYSSNCDDSSCPFMDTVFKNANTWPVYANIGMFRATGEQKYINAAVRDADTMLAWCEEDNRECVRVLYQINELYKETNDVKYRDFVTEVAGVLLADEDGLFGIDLSMGHGIDSIEFSNAYGFNGDSVFLDAAIDKVSMSEDALSIETVLYELDGNKYYSQSCWSQLAKLELHEVTGETSYLQEVEDFVTSRNVAGNVGSMAVMTDMQSCTDVYLSLAELTGDSSYMEGAENMMQHMLTNYWDSSSNPKVSGNNAVLISTYTEFTTITEASYMVYLLSRMGESSLEV